MLQVFNRSQIVRWLRYHFILYFVSDTNMFIVNHMIIGALKSLGAAKPPIKEKAVGIVLARAALPRTESV